MAGYVIADTHFWHDNVIDFCQRPFATSKEMNEYMVNAWNSTVNKNDVVWHLGDVSFGGSENTIKICQSLNGQKILVRGNHDKRTVTFWKRAGFREVFNRPFYSIKYGVVMSHAPMRDLPSSMKNIHGHTHDLYTGLNQRQWACVSVEMTMYAPMLVQNVINQMAG